MAFKSKESGEATSASFKLFTGVAPVNVVAVNPTAEELSKIYGRPVEKVADYTGKDKNGKEYSRIDIIVKVVDDVQPDTFGKISFFFRGEPRTNTAGNKIQVINCYGQTAWLTEEQYKNKQLPTKNDGTPMGYLMPYLPCYAGEEDLVKFILAFLNIPAPVKMENGLMVNKILTELEDCEAYFTAGEKKMLSQGNMKPLKDAISMRPNNVIKVMFTISEQNGRKYQNILNTFFAKNSDFNAVSRFDKYMNDNSSRMTNVIWSSEFKEYKEEPTSFTKPADTGSPWD